MSTNYIRLWNSFLCNIRCVHFDNLYTIKVVTLWCTVLFCLDNYNAQFASFSSLGFLKVYYNVFITIPPTVNDSFWKDSYYKSTLTCTICILNNNTHFFYWHRFGNTAYLHISVAFIQMLKALSMWIKYIIHSLLYIVKICLHTIL